MEFALRAPVHARRVALLSAAWNPPTRAHLALAHAALAHVDHVLLTLPRAFPHKAFDDTSFDTRLDWLQRLAMRDERFGVAISDGGLYIDLARALRHAAPHVNEVAILCGVDAAERFLAWNYAPPTPPVDAQLNEFTLLVAPRPHRLEVPPTLRSRVVELTLDADYAAHSSNDVRTRIRSGNTWTHLVPDAIAHELEAHYAQQPSRDR